MKALRLLLFFLLALIVTVAALSFIEPTHQKVERSVSINAPAEKIYVLLSHLSTFREISVWSKQDSTAVYTITGTDGTTGASLGWKGHPEISGEGAITIKTLDRPRFIAHDWKFDSPKKGTANSVFTLQQTDPSLTKVTWTFYLDTPRPWNIFNLFSSLDKQMGADFEAGLATLKKLAEGNEKQ